MINQSALLILENAELKLNLIKYEHPGFNFEELIDCGATVLELKTAIEDQDYPRIFKLLKDAENSLSKLPEDNLLVEWDLYSDIRKTAVAIESMQIQLNAA